MAPWGSKQITCPFFVYPRKYVYMYIYIYTFDRPCAARASCDGLIGNGRGTSFPSGARGINTQKGGRGPIEQMRNSRTVVYIRRAPAKFMFGPSLSAPPPSAGTRACLYIRRQRLKPGPPPPTPALVRFALPRAVRPVLHGTNSRRTLLRPPCRPDLVRPVSVLYHSDLRRLAGTRVKCTRNA